MTLKYTKAYANIFLNTQANIFLLYLLGVIQSEVEIRQIRPEDSTVIYWDSECFIFNLTPRVCKKCWEKCQSSKVSLKHMIKWAGDILWLKQRPCNLNFVKKKISDSFTINSQKPLKNLYFQIMFGSITQSHVLWTSVDFLSLFLFVCWN